MSVQGSLNVTYKYEIGDIYGKGKYNGVQTIELKCYIFVIDLIS